MIRNKTKNTTIAKDSKIAKSHSDKMFGFITNTKLDGLVFFSRFGIHTFFMKFPIDVLILDDKNKVCLIKKNLKPNNIFFWNPKFYKIIELKAGLLEKSETQVTHEIEFEV